jgi:L-asparaginase II
VESVHRVHAVVVDAEGRRLHAAGDPGLGTFLRSAAKPLQALPLVEDGVVRALGITPAELALCCASHSSQENHVAVASSLLARAGADETALACGGHPPLSPVEATRMREAGVTPGPIHSNCSGKHAGMLALARFHGWPARGYHRAHHPVQRRMAHEVARWTGLDGDEIALGIDGCGVVCFRVPLERAALAMARFARAASRGEGPAAVVSAMVGHPEMVAGRGRLCTALMQAGGGAVFAKTGAEGVYVLGRPHTGEALALKVEDGGTRGAEAAAVAIAEALEWIPAEAEGLARWRRGPVTSTRGETVGYIEVDEPFEEGG